MPDRTLLIQKLTNFQKFIKDSILIDMKLNNEKIKQNIIDNQKKLNNNDFKEEDVNKLLAMTNIVHFVINMDIDKELNDKYLKKLEIGVLEYISPLFENDGINLLKKIILTQFLAIDENYRLSNDNLDKIMLYLEFLHDYFNE